MKRPAFSSVGAVPASLGATVVLLSVSAMAQQGSNGGAGGLEEVIVTAQRRAERSIDVPLSVSSFNADQLVQRGIANSRDLGAVVPGLRIEAVGVYVQPSVRGVTTSIVTPGGDSNVATYLDGVYQGNQSYAIFDLPDIERIEVLKGPQGTLFGRNATGGAIQLFTQDPSFETAGRVSLGYGRFDERVAKLFVTGPIAGDRVAGGISGYHREHNGYHKDLLRNGRRTGELESNLARGKLLFKITERFDAQLSAMYSKIEDEGVLQYTSFNGNNLARLIAPGFAVIASRPHHVSQDTASYIEQENWQFALRLRAQLPWGELTSLTASNEFNTFSKLDLDASSLPLAVFDTSSHNRAISEELTFSSSPLGPVEVVGGLFYYHRDAGFDPSAFNDAPVFTKDKTKAYAIFGELKYTFTDRLSAIAGIRYSREDIDQRSGVDPHVALIDVEKRYTSTTPRLSLLYGLNESTNVYFTYSEGFKSGLFNSQSLDPRPVHPEEIKAYELGLKYEPTVAPVRLHASVFYNDFTDLQAQTIIGNFSVIQNAAAVKNYGADVDLAWSPTRHLSLQAGASYLSSEYDEFPNAAVLIPLPGNSGNISSAADVKDNKTVRSPEWSLNAAAIYERDYGFGNVALSANVSYSSRVYFDFENRVSQKPYSLVNARATWNPFDTRFKLGLWARNLTDKDLIVSTTLTELADAVVYAPPRTYGIDLEYSF